MGNLCRTNALPCIGSAWESKATIPEYLVGYLLAAECQGHRGVPTPPGPVCTTMTTVGPASILSMADQPGKAPTKGPFSPSRSSWSLLLPPLLSSPSSPAKRRGPPKRCSPGFSPPSPSCYCKHTASLLITMRLPRSTTDTDCLRQTQHLDLQFHQHHSQRGMRQRPTSLPDFQRHLQLSPLSGRCPSPCHNLHLSNPPIHLDPARHPKLEESGPNAVAPPLLRTPWPVLARHNRNPSCRCHPASQRYRDRQ